MRRRRLPMRWATWPPAPRIVVPLQQRVPSQPWWIWSPLAVLRLRRRPRWLWSTWKRTLSVWRLLVPPPPLVCVCPRLRLWAPGASVWRRWGQRSRHWKAARRIKRPRRPNSLELGQQFQMRTGLPSAEKVESRHWWVRWSMVAIKPNGMLPGHSETLPTTLRPRKPY